MTKASLPRMDVLGVPVNLIDMPRAVAAITGWAEDSTPHTVFARDVASLMLAVEEPQLRRLHDEASLVVPDGMPLVWLGRLRGHDICRVAGPDLVDAVCAASLSTGQSHYFYGGKPSVAEKMASRLAARYPGLKIAGIFSPPVRDIGPAHAFDAGGLAELQAIKAANPDFIWIGISSPKQEYWMMQAAPLVGRGVFLGVGAAFDFHAGTVPRAPTWTQNNGLEWLHRLIREPRRLWRRYLVLAPKFVLSLMAEPFRRDRAS